ncbi:MAG: branched-chain amino acid ABC transporter permease, partial [Selenomonas sp.]
RQLRARIDAALRGVQPPTASDVALLSILQAALASWPEFRMIIFAVALILFMLYRPKGIFGYVELTAFGPLKRIFGKGGQANG